MKIGEIIRHIADITDLATELEPGEEQGVYSPVPAQMEPVPQQPDVEPNNDDSNDEIMVPPLQQKHELLKKATGVENNTDQFANDEVDPEDPNEDDLKKLAGIKDPNPAAMPILSISHDFEPVDD